MGQFRNYGFSVAAAIAAALISVPAAAVVVPFGGTSAPGTDPLGHPYQLDGSFGTPAWGIPGLGFGTVPFNPGALTTGDGLDYATSFHFVVLQGPVIDTPGTGFFQTRLQNIRTGGFWTAVLDSPQQVSFFAGSWADRLMPGDDFFVNVVFTTTPDPQRFAFGALWDAQAIPEPATWAMMLAGFGMIGFAMRRRQRTIATITG